MCKHEEETIFFAIDGRFGMKDKNLRFVPSVCKRDVQLFLKRLRKSLEPEKIRYFLTAEYGAKTMRPHYHLIIYFDSVDRQKYYDAVTNCWSFGHVDFGECEQASVAYCTKYCLKETPSPEYALKPFRLMSSKPALGDIGYQKYLEFVRESNLQRSAFKNLRAATPRLWRDKFIKQNYNDEEKAILQTKRHKEYEQKKEEDYQRWRKVHNGTHLDYIVWLNELRQRKEELIKKRLSKTKL